VKVDVQLDPVQLPKLSNNCSTIKNRSRSRPIFLTFYLQFGDIARNIVVMATLNRQTLPRHTILAKQSSRVGAFFVDLAFSLLYFLVLFYGCFNLVFSTCFTNELVAERSTYEYNSHLVYYNDVKKTLDIYKSNDDYTVFETPVKYYYFSYLTGENIDLPEKPAYEDSYYASPLCNKPIVLEDGSKVLPKDYYNVAWYNEHVLLIEGDWIDDPDNAKSICLFTYPYTIETVDGVETKIYDTTKLGIPRTQVYDDGALRDVTSTELARQYSLKYEEAYYHLTSLSFYYDVSTKINFYMGLSAMIPIILAGAITYVIIPLFMKNGATIGKKIFKLGLANMQGFKMKKYQLLTRFIPYFLTCLCVLLITYQSIYICLIIVAVMFLSSFAVSMGSPKKCALHDYTGQTIVIDAKDSIIFENYLTEEAYALKEEKIDQDRLVQGEEPELKYEK
jgi:uncharacterized RDD family membrane protein YckC